MKIANSKLFFICAITTTSAFASPVFKYEFDSEYAGGVEGAIKVEYASADSTVATITADLDFNDVDFSQIQNFDSNCTEEVTQYKWHIHVNWGSTETSQSFAQCGLPITGNHYDPLHACGPNSEFVGTPECLLKTPNYACTPETYQQDPLACEKGDLSGKFGDLYLDGGKRVWSQWTDPNYPAVSENTPTWNIILHAVCGKATPRIACAQIQQKESHQPYTDNSDYHNTPAPTTTYEY